MARNGINDDFQDFVDTHNIPSSDRGASNETRSVSELKNGDLGGSQSHFQPARGVTSDTAALVCCDELNARLHGVEPGPDGSAIDDESVHCHRPREQHQDTTARNQLIAVSFLCLLFMIAEIAGGVLSGSLALMTDATHMACDLTGFLISLAALWLAQRKATTRLSFGYHRAEVLGAFFSILLIWVLTGVLVYLAVDRVMNEDYEIEADDMLIVASLGVLFNVVMGLVLNSGLFKCCRVAHSHFGHSHSGDHSHSSDHSHGQPLSDPVSSVDVDVRLADPPKQNINIKAAMVHVVGDFFQSIGVLIAAIIIKIEPSYKLADPICTFIFSVLVLITTCVVLRDVCLIFMEAVPRDLDYVSIRRDLQSIPGVRLTHSLNIWALTSHKIAVAVHLAIDPDTDWREVLETATNLLRDSYHIHQSTIQVEEFDLSMESCQQCTGPV